MDIASSVHGVPIRLTDERWRHIVESRDEVAGLYDDVLRTVEMPDFVVEDRDGALMALRAGIMERTMVVVYRETDDKDGFIITAWLTTRAHRQLRLKRIWTKEQ